MIQCRPVSRYIRLDRKDISYIRYVFEGYDGVANVTTVDGRKAVVRVTAVPDFVDVADEIIEALSREIRCELLS